MGKLALRGLLGLSVGLAIIGLSASTPAAWLAQGATGGAAALACVVLLQARTPEAMRLGGGSLVGAGMGALLGVGFGLVELLVRHSLASVALVAAPLAVVTAVLVAVAALRVSTALPSPRALRLLALVAFGVAVGTTVTFARQWRVLPALPFVSAKQP